MKYKNGWEETKERFEAWWRHENIDRPLMKVIAKRKEPLESLEESWKPRTPEDRYLEVERKVRNMRNYCRTHIFMAESFPSIDIDMGAGSMSIYLGLEPKFTWETVWFKECIDDWETWGPLKYDPENYWWNKHVEVIRRGKELAQGDFLVTIPDIIENLDILAAMRGTQNLCFDMIDRPELVKSYLHQLDEIYFRYYDQIYDIVKDKDGGSSYTTFSIWGPGKTAKIQCDFSAIISPDHFREFALPSLRKQCQKLDYSLYHLDGSAAIRHVEALMEIDELDALQWTAGAGQPDGGSEKWYSIYDQVAAANKSLWIMFSDGGINDWIESADKLVTRYGPERLYFLFPVMEEEDALRLMKKAETDWKGD